MDQSVPRSIRTVRVALTAQATRWRRSPGVVGPALLQLVQGKAMKSRQMGINVKLIWLAAIWAASSKHDWIAALSGEIGCRLPKTEWGTPPGGPPERNVWRSFRNQLEVWRGWFLGARILGGAVGSSAANEKI
jgi:hypothetical protein